MSKNRNSKTNRNKSQIVNQNKDSTSTVTHGLSFTHAGPLPLPQILDGYKNIDSSFSERIVAMAEKQDN